MRRSNEGRVGVRVRKAGTQTGTGHGCNSVGLDVLAGVGTLKSLGDRVHVRLGSNLGNCEHQFPTPTRIVPVRIISESNYRFEVVQLAENAVIHRPLPALRLTP